MCGTDLCFPVGHSWYNRGTVNEQELVTRSINIMCRSIKQLRLPDTTATDAEIEAAALQFVRKISGYRKPSRANQAAFDTAVAEIAAATRLLLDQVDNHNRQSGVATVH
jgi:hypothetical protein